MREIIKILKKSPAIRFMCPTCETVFEADKDECKEVHGRNRHINHLDYKIGCPECGCTVYHKMNTYFN